jgi:hypothetical protein
MFLMQLNDTTLAPIPGTRKTPTFCVLGFFLVA